MNAEVELINYLATDSLLPDPDQPRKLFDPIALQSLADDIAARGIIQPITVRINADNQTVIVYGERRWRAAQLAKLETVPTILDTRERDDIDRLIDQVSENLSRDDLKPIEMARFFDTLHSKHAIKMKDIPQILEQRGLKHMERSYISNMRRLVELPEWAQEYINDGKLTPSHGKYILQLKGIDNAMDELKEQIDAHCKDEDRAPTIADMSYLLDESMGAFYTDMYQAYKYRQFRFDPDEACKGHCTNCRLINGQWSKSLYCLDDACREQKTQEAEDEYQKTLAKSQKKTKPVTSTVRQPGKLTETDAPRVETSIGPDPDREDESPSPQQVALKQGRIERTEQYLDRWLREQVRQHLRTDNETSHAVILWLSAGAPGNYSQYDGHIGRPQLDYHTEQHGINIALKHRVDHTELMYQVIDCAIDTMSRSNLRKLSHHCQIVLEGNYSIDEEYLNIKSKDELIKTTPEAVRDAFDDWNKTIKGPVGDLVVGIANRETQYGIPQDLQAMYDAFAEPQHNAREAEAA